MAITRVFILHVPLPLRWSVGHAAARRRSSDNIFAAVELEDGTVGFGEGLPRPYVTGETVESCWEALEGLDAEPLVAAWPSAKAADEVLSTLSATPSARSALELAFLDAAGRSSGRPAAALASEVLGIEPPVEREVAYSAVLPFAGPSLLKMLCWGARLYGFPSAKLKVGKTVSEETHRLKAVRGWLGPSVELRADANGAWSPEEALIAMEACRRTEVACLEQPVAPEDWPQLADLTGGAPAVALMADESLCGEEDLVRLMATGALQAANCRIAKMGGLIPSARLGRAALEAGLEVLVGCHVSESTLLSAAGRHLAALLPEARWYEGSFDRWLLKASVAREPLGFGRGGKASVSLSPGLGVEVDRQALERLSSRKLTVWPAEGSRR
jgi:muconate cycloisomerase